MHSSAHARRLAWFNTYACACVRACVHAIQHLAGGENVRKPARRDRLRQWQQPVSATPRPDKCTTQNQDRQINAVPAAAVTAVAAVVAVHRAVRWWRLSGRHGSGAGWPAAAKCGWYGGDSRPTRSPSATLVSHQPASLWSRPYTQVFRLRYSPVYPNVTQMMDVCIVYIFVTTH